MNKLILACALPLVALSTMRDARAQTLPAPDKPVRFLLGIGVSGGGDKLASGQYQDGSAADLHAAGWSTSAPASTTT